MMSQNIHEMPRVNIFNLPAACFAKQTNPMQNEKGCTVHGEVMEMVHIASVIPCALITNKGCRSGSSCCLTCKSLPLI